MEKNFPPPPLAGGETTPTAAGKRFYFLNKTSDSFKGEKSSLLPSTASTTASSKEKSKNHTAIDIPEEPNETSPLVPHKPTESVAGGDVGHAQSTSWFLNWFRQQRSGCTTIENAPKTRMVPVKIEPKVFFANERTFLAWLHMSVTLATISIGIVAFADANHWSKVYGLTLMPVAIAFSIYSLWLYVSRARMIRLKLPGPCLSSSVVIVCCCCCCCLLSLSIIDEEKIGPIVLSVLLATALLVNFVVKLLNF